MVKGIWGLACCGLAVAGLTLGVPSANAASTQNYLPAQFVAKQYTEGLGRMPDQPGWHSAASWFAANGCTAQGLAGFGESLFTSTEYTGLGYDNTGKLVTLYRGSLDREADKSGMDNWLGELSGGMSWSDVVAKFFTSSEFTALVPKICSGAVDASASSYYFGTFPAIALPTSGSGITGDEQAVQTALDAAPAGGTVTLAKRALIELTQPLVIPTGVTLTTAGSPDPRHYADMARLVRAANFAEPKTLTGMVQVRSNATASNVWIDGVRNTPGNTAPLTDVMTYGTGATVNSDVIGNTQAPNTVYLLGGFDGYTCGSATVSGNLVTAYSSDHYLANDWTDGISDNCEGASITGNQVVDATDVGIVVYRNTTTSAQHSVVSGNSVLSAGNSMYGGLGFDPLFGPAGSPAQTFPFTGGKITGNTVWSGPDSHFDIGITDGSRAWFAGTYTADTGTGAAITGNTTGTVGARVQTGVAVNGMLDTTVSGNTLTFSHIGTGTCAKVDYAAELAEHYASGTFDPQPTDVNLDGCV
jgi:hypothetical protein